MTLLETQQSEETQDIPEYIGPKDYTPEMLKEFKELTINNILNFYKDELSNGDFGELSKSAKLDLVDNGIIRRDKSPGLVSSYVFTDLGKKIFESLTGRPIPLTIEEMINQFLTINIEVIPSSEYVVCETDGELLYSLKKIIDETIKGNVYGILYIDYLSGSFDPDFYPNYSSDDPV